MVYNEVTTNLNFTRKLPGPRFFLQRNYNEICETPKIKIPKPQTYISILSYLLHIQPLFPTETINSKFIFKCILYKIEFDTHMKIRSSNKNQHLLHILHHEESFEFSSTSLQ